MWLRRTSAIAFALCVLSSPLLAADRTVFVDGTTSGTPGTNGAHYASLSAAIAGEVGAAPDLVTGTAILSIECSIFPANAADTTAVTVNGFTTNASFYVRIYAASASRASTAWSATKYRLETANASALVIRTPYTRVDGLQIGKSAANGNDQNGVEIFGIDTTVNILSNLLIRHAEADDFRQTGIYLNDGDITAYIYNVIDFGHPDVDSNYNTSIVIEGATAASVYSSTLVAYRNGIWLVVNIAVPLKNVYAFFVTGNDFVAALGSFSQTTTASSGTGGTIDNVALNTTNFTNVTFATMDLSLPATGSALDGVGTNTSGDAAPMNFTTDINGVTRVDPWDIGAYQIPAASTTRNNLTTLGVQ